MKCHAFFDVPAAKPVPLSPMLSMRVGARRSDGFAVRPRLHLPVTLSPNSIASSTRTWSRSATVSVVAQRNPLVKRWAR